LIHAATGHYLWSEHYEREMQDVFAIQDDISRSIVGTLRVRLSSGEKAPLVRRYPTDPESQTLYHKARYFWNRRTQDSLTRSVELFEQVLERDPDHAPAWAGMADAYSLMAQYGVAAPKLAMPKAKAAAQRALQLDETLAEAHTSLALVESVYEWQWSKAEQHYQRAIRLNPGYATARHWYGVDFLAMLGRFDEALAQIRIAQSLDPLSLAISSAIGFIYVMSRQPDRAVEQFEGLIDLEPRFYRAYSGLGRAYLQLGRYDDAAAVFEKARQLSWHSAYIAGALAESYALSGRRQEAVELLNKLLEERERGFVLASSIATVYSGLNEPERALDWLEKACDERETSLAMMKVYPAYDRVRDNPRFQKLLERVGLA
jgi:tetratricopeptide (TPR) repeat protein